MDGSIMNKSDIVSALECVGVYPSEYGFGGYCECAPFIEQVDGVWNVYVGERGGRQLIKVCESLEDIVEAVCCCLGKTIGSSSKERHEKLTFNDNVLLLLTRNIETITPVFLADFILNAINIVDKPFLIGSFARLFGIQVYRQNIINPNLKGYLSLDGDPIIAVNTHTLYAEQCFVVAHLMWHYLYDCICKKSSEKYFAKYESLASADSSGKLADEFAFDLLITNKVFKKFANRLTGMNSDLGVEMLAVEFGMPEYMVRDKIRKLGIPIFVD